VLAIMLDSVHEQVSRYTGIIWAETAAGCTVTQRTSGGTFLWITSNPIISITKICPLNSDGTADDALDASEYAYQATSERPVGRVWKTNGSEWANYYESAPSWLIEYKAGYAETTCPAGLKAVMLDWLKRNYEARGGKASEGVSGISSSWTPLYDTDFIKQLRPYSFLTGVL